nr:MAG TPA: hypothetical protein [Caudoviricetes sp.]
MGAICPPYLNKMVEAKKREYELAEKKVNDLENKLALAKEYRDVCKEELDEVSKA